MHKTKLQVFHCVSGISVVLILPLFYVLTVIELSAEIATLQSAVLCTRNELREAIKDHHNLQVEATTVQSDQAAE